MERRKISYTKDILERIRPKQTMKQKEELAEHLLEYIAKQTETNEVFAINMPRLGVLYCSEAFQKNRAKNSEKDYETYALLKMHMDESEEKTKHTVMPRSFIAAKYLNKEYELAPYREYSRTDRHYLEALAVLEQIQNNNTSKFSL